MAHAAQMALLPRSPADARCGRLERALAEQSQRLTSLGSMVGDAGGDGEGHIISIEFPSAAE